MSAAPDVTFQKDPFYGRTAHPSLRNVANYLLDHDGGEVQAAFAAFARQLLSMEDLSENAEFTVALRKLLEARDAIERCIPREDH